MKGGNVYIINTTYVRYCTLSDTEQVSAYRYGMYGNDLPKRTVVSAVVEFTPEWRTRTKEMCLFVYGVEHHSGAGLLPLLTASVDSVCSRKDAAHMGYLHV